MTCPHCGNALRQLGEVKDGEWVGENLWSCWNCNYGENRFKMVGGKSVAMTPEEAAAV